MIGLNENNVKSVKLEMKLGLGLEFCIAILKYFAEFFKSIKVVRHVIDDASSLSRCEEKTEVVGGQLEPVS